MFIICFSNPVFADLEKKYSAADDIVQVGFTSTENGILIKASILIDKKTGKIKEVNQAEIVAKPSSINNTEIIDYICTEEYILFSVRFRNADGVFTPESAYLNRDMLNLDNIVRGTVIAGGEKCIVVEALDEDTNYREYFLFFVTEDTSIYSKRGYDDPFKEIQIGMNVIVTFPFNAMDEYNKFVKGLNVATASEIQYFYPSTYFME